jgi:putative solute:sodium symporter small subunit
MPSTDARARYWRHHLRVTGLLLALWLGVSFGVALYARALSFKLFGAPFSVWIAGQGALVVFVLIVWASARISAREDRRLEGEADESP